MESSDTMGTGIATGAEDERSARMKRILGNGSNEVVNYIMDENDFETESLGHVNVSRVGSPIKEPINWVQNALFQYNNRLFFFFRFIDRYFVINTGFIFKNQSWSAHITVGH